MKICTFQKKKVQRGVYTKEGENICPPSKIIYMKYLLILLGRMFLTLTLGTTKLFTVTN